MHSSKELQFQIKAIQEHQQKLIADKSLIMLSEDDQLTWCRLNRELGMLAYEAYQVFAIEKNFDDAVNYFILSQEIGFEPAISELFTAREQDAIRDLNDDALKEMPDKLFILAMINFLGLGREKNRANAIVLLEQAAEQAYARAQNRLGTMYILGQGITKDITRAVELFSNAAERGDTFAQFNLARLYENGQGVVKDAALAIKWYHKAAEQGYVLAQLNLGHIYNNGLGIATNKARAIEWFRRAAEQGNARAQYNLAINYFHEWSVIQDISLAIDLFHKSAEQGNDLAQYYLGKMYYDGVYVKKNYAQAIKWYRKAAEQNHAVAQDCLGLMYYDGIEVIKDDEQAITLFRTSAEQGYDFAQYHLAAMYYNGDGVERNLLQAIEWFTRTAELGNMFAQFNLGKIYDDEEYATKDSAKAFEWYSKAAKQGFADAQNNLGQMYERGNSVKKDSTQAARWYHQAAEQNKEQAIKNLQIDTPIHKIHLALLNADREQIESLVKNNPELSDEIIWNLERSVDDDTRYNSVTSIIYPLLNNTSWSRDIINQVKLSYLISAHAYQIKNPEEKTFDSYLELITPFLLEVDIKDIKDGQIIPILMILIDAWYATYELYTIDKHTEFTTTAANLIIDILALTLERQIPFEDTHCLRQCALILIRSIYGSEYESSFIPPNIDQLIFFISSLQKNPTLSVSSVNQLLGFELVKQTSKITIDYVDLLNQLSNYVNQEALVDLKKYLNQEWQGLEKKDEITARAVMLKLTDTVNEWIQLSKRQANLFFSIDDVSKKFIYQSIAKSDWKLISEFLHEKMNVLVDQANLSMSS